MNQRQEDLFKNIVEEHIIEGKAIGSDFLTNKYVLGVSSATVRNDMAEMEKTGLIYQPHTSAGRLPTAKGYSYYVDKYLKQGTVISRKDRHLLDNLKEKIKNREMLAKHIAKTVADLSCLAVLVGFSKDSYYYTGLSHLFSQPEFSNLDIIHNVSLAVDHMDDVLADIYAKIDDTAVDIGDGNCFSDDCASIFTKADDILFGVIGPLRMDYRKNLGLVNYSRELLKN